MRGGPPKAVGAAVVLGSLRALADGSMAGDNALGRGFGLVLLLGLDVAAGVALVGAIAALAARRPRPALASGLLVMLVGLGGAGWSFLQRHTFFPGFDQAYGWAHAGAAVVGLGVAVFAAFLSRRAGPGSNAQ